VGCGAGVGEGGGVTPRQCTSFRDLWFQSKPYAIAAALRKADREAGTGLAPAKRRRVN
jgi:hypothetical protein